MYSYIAMLALLDIIGKVETCVINNQKLMLAPMYVYIAIASYYTYVATYVTML